MIKPFAFEKSIIHFHDQFVHAAEQYDGSTNHMGELQAVIDSFSLFVTNADNQHKWALLMPDNDVELQALIARLRDISARCVAIMEKYRAIRLLESGDNSHEYFQHIEASIEQEFGSFEITPASSVLLVGSGSFPMTPLLIASRTGAEVTAIDIDGEAIALGQKIVAKLGADLRIKQHHLPLELLDDIQQKSHIIISSTVAVKYELLEWLHDRTQSDVVVSIRYGNGLKSLFNYPMMEVDKTKWLLAEASSRPHHIFDVALYRKRLPRAFAEEALV